MRLRPEATIKRMTVLLNPTRIWQRTPGEQKEARKSKLILLVKACPADTHRSGYLPGIEGNGLGKAYFCLTFMISSQVGR